MSASPRSRGSQLQSRPQSRLRGWSWTPKISGLCLSALKEAWAGEGDAGPLRGLPLLHLTRAWWALLKRPLQHFVLKLAPSQSPGETAPASPPRPLGRRFQGTEPVPGTSCAGKAEGKTASSCRRVWDHAARTLYETRLHTVPRSWGPGTCSEGRWGRGRTRTMADRAAASLCVPPGLVETLLWKLPD